MLKSYDFLYASVVVGLAFSALGIYAVRVMRRGVVRYDRTNAVGGSALLSKRFVEMGYWALLPMARGCVAVGITPNAITWISLALGIGSGIALAFGALGLGGLLALISGLGDILDGQVARLSKTGSAAGEVLDASVDRYMEFFYVGGLVLFYREDAIVVTTALGAMLAAFMVSYSTAKAEAMRIDPPKGAMRRHERSVYLIGGAVLSSIFAPWLEPLAATSPVLRTAPMIVALAIVAVAGNASAVRRLVLTARALKARDAAAPQGPSAST